MAHVFFVLRTYVFLSYGWKEHAFQNNCSAQRVNQSPYAINYSVWTVCCCCCVYFCLFSLSLKKVNIFFWYFLFWKALLNSSFVENFFLLYLSTYLHICFLLCVHANFYPFIPCSLHLSDARKKIALHVPAVFIHYKRRLFFSRHLHFQPFLVAVIRCDGVLDFYLRDEFAARFECHRSWFFFAADLR